MTREELEAAVEAKRKRVDLETAVEMKRAQEKPSADSPDAGFYIRSGLAGHTASLSEPIISGLKALGSANAATPVWAEAGVDYDPEELAKAFKEDMQMRSDEKKKFPMQDMAAQVAGSLVPSPLNVPAKVIGGVSKILPGAKAAATIAEDAPWFQRALQATKEGFKPANIAANAAQGAATNAALTGVQKLATGEGDVGTSAVVGGLVGGALTPVASSLRGGAEALKQPLGDVLDGIKKYGKKTAGLIFGLHPDQIDELALRIRDKSLPPLDDALSEQDLRDKMRLAGSKMRGVVDTATTDADRAAIAAKEAADQVTGFQRETKGYGAAYNATAKDSFKAKTEAMLEKHASEVEKAKDVLDKAYKAKKAELAGVELPAEYGKQVTEAIGGLKQKVSKLSNEAFDVLATSGQTVPKNGLIDIVRARAQALKDPELGVLDKKAYAAVNNLAAEMEGFSDNLSMGSLKKFIQHLDESTNYSPNAADFSEGTNRALKDIRREVDQFLKGSVEGYNEAMASTSAVANLLDQAKEIGTEVGALGIPSKLKQADKASYYRDLLQRVSKESGNDVLSPAQKVVAAREQASKLKPEALPEAERLRQLLASVKKPTPPVEYTPFDADAYKNLLLKRNKTTAVAAQKAAAAKSLVDEFQPVLGLGDSSISDLVMLRGRDKALLQNKLDMISKFADDPNFLRQVKDRNMLEILKKPNTNGARRTLLGSLVGGPVGAMVGFITDISGKEIGKAALEKFIEIGPAVDAAKIQAVKASPAVKEAMLRGYYNILSQSGKSQ